MITDFKIFESEYFKNNYSVGDYVLIKDGILLDIVSRFSKIVQDFSITEGTDGYDVEFTNGNIYYIIDNFIERYLTPEEIEEYELQKSKTKYNL